MIKLSEVKNRCSKGRFFSYNDWRDKLFVPPSIILVWIFLNLRLSGNFVSILSGLIAICCGVLLTSSNPYLILIGSFGYMIFYLLDYVDGGVARFNGKSGIGGQYVDWIMHVVVSVAMTSGLLIGAMNSSGEWIAPFGIFAIVASALTFDRYSYAWFAIAMYYQQRKTKKNNLNLLEIRDKKPKINFFYISIRRFTALFYHENYAFFIYPFLAILHLKFFDIYDFRLLLIIIGSLVYFPFLIYDIIRLSRNSVIDNMYNETFINNKPPNLPNDHFFE